MGEKRKRSGQGAGENIDKNKIKITCQKCNIQFKSCSDNPACPKCRTPIK
jgi:Zn finger protein HypA/HybF involved in hydrogenase expression